MYIVLVVRRGGSSHEGTRGGRDVSREVEGPHRSRRLRIRITYMHCKGCAATIQGTLRRAPGVLEAVVNYSSGEGSLAYDPSITNLERILSDPIFREPSPFEAELLEGEEA